MEAPHWIVRVMNCISDPSWWDGVNLGLAAAAALVFAALVIGLPLYQALAAATVIIIAALAVLGKP